MEENCIHSHFGPIYSLQHIETCHDFVKAHVQCWNDYTRAHGVVLPSDKITDDKHPARKLRSQSDAFTWKYDCFCLTKRVLVDEQNNAHIIFQDSWIPWHYSWCQSSPSSTHRHAIYHKKYQTGRKHLGSLQQLVHQTTLININHSLKCATASNELCTLVNLHQSKISLCGSDESAVYSVQTLKR